MDESRVKIIYVETRCTRFVVFNEFDFLVELKPYKNVTMFMLLIRKRITKLKSDEKIYVLVPNDGWRKDRRKYIKNNPDSNSEIFYGNFIIGSLI